MCSAFNRASFILLCTTTATRSSGWNKLAFERLPESSDICTFLMLLMYAVASCLSISTLSFCAATTPAISSMKSSQPGNLCRQVLSTKSWRVPSLVASLTTLNRPREEILKPCACLFVSFMKFPIRRMKDMTFSRLADSVIEFETFTTSLSLIEISSYSGSNLLVSARPRILCLQ